MKIFRDLIYVMQGMMKADHRFYKAHGIYDFPQKQKKRILQMKLVGALLAIPSIQKKMKGQMNQYIIGPYQKVVDTAAKIRDSQSVPFTKEREGYGRKPEKQKNR